MNASKLQTAGRAIARACLAAAIGFLVSDAVQADTFVSGVIGTQTWTTNNSPYEVTADLTVQSGATLTIESGVLVRFQENSQFIIEGNLQILADKANEVRLTAESTDWEGIFFSSSEGISLVQHAIIERVDDSSHGTFPIRMEASQVRFEHCEIRENTDGGIIDIEESFVLFDSCQIRNNVFNSNIDIGSGSQAIFRNCLLANNTSTSYRLIYADPSASLELTHCTFAFNLLGEGRYALVVGSTALIRSCVFSGNRDSANVTRDVFHSAPTSAPALDHCLVEQGFYAGPDSNCIFQPAAFRNPTTTPGGISFPPGTSNGQPADYRLTAGSFGIDAGSNDAVGLVPTGLGDVPRPHNGTADMGCYEYAPDYADGTTVTIDHAVRIEALTEAGRVYRFWYADHINSNDWHLLDDAVVGDGGVVGVFDSTENAAHRYYRITDAVE